MLVIESRKSIFIHVEKCAGTAVEVSLDTHLAVFDVQIGGTDFGESVQTAYRKRFGLHKHSTALEVKKVIGDDYCNYFSFALVRHPLTRIVSAYRYLQEQVWNPKLQEKVSKQSIVEFVNSGNANWLKPCYGYIYSAENERLVNYVAKVENIAHEFNSIAQHIGIPQAKLLKANMSSKGSSEDLKIQLINCAKSIEVINKRYARDFESFNYAKLELGCLPGKSNEKVAGNQKLSINQQQPRESSLINKFKRVLSAQK